MQTLFQHGVELINQGSYYHAHDVLEEVWREVRGEDRLFYQGVVQVAIAMHHFSKANLAGAQSVLAKARKNLAPYPSKCGGIDLEDLRRQLELWDAAIASAGPYPEPVQIRPLAVGC
jgi:predicted metal-dependent hydrolase